VNICQQTAEQVYAMCKEGRPEDDPEETVLRIRDAVRSAMFRAGYCQPRCDTKDCEQVDGGHAT
jgi:hypothetical protein